MKTISVSQRRESKNQNNDQYGELVSPIRLVMERIDDDESSEKGGGVVIKFRLPKVTFAKYNWLKDCYYPSLLKFYNGKMWTFSAYKIGVTFDFRNCKCGAK